MHFSQTVSVSVKHRPDSRTILTSHSLPFRLNKSHSSPGARNATARTSQHWNWPNFSWHLINRSFGEGKIISRSFMLICIWSRPDECWTLLALWVCAGVREPGTGPKLTHGGHFVCPTRLWVFTFQIGTAITNHVHRRCWNIYAPGGLSNRRRTR